jgi:hypothetical protein
MNRCGVTDEAQPGAICQDDEGHGGNHTPQPGFTSWHNESYVPPATREAQTDISGMATRVRARRTDPETSVAAALSVGNLRRSQLAVHSFLSEVGPIHDEQWVPQYHTWAAAHEEPQQSESGLRTRRSECVEVGLIRDTGQRVVVESNREAIVWEAVPRNPA